VLSYHIRWDQSYDGLVWSDLLDSLVDRLDTEYIVSDNVVAGKIHNFQVRSKNKWGWSAWSPVASIKASTWPA